MTSSSLFRGSDLQVRPIQLTRFAALAAEEKVFLASRTSSQVKTIPPTQEQS